jgi:hypothetical protein
MRNPQFAKSLLQVQVHVQAALHSPAASLACMISAGQQLDFIVASTRTVQSMQPLQTFV